MERVYLDICIRRVEARPQDDPAVALHAIYLPRYLPWDCPLGTRHGQRRVLCSSRAVSGPVVVSLGSTAALWPSRLPPMTMRILCLPALHLLGLVICNCWHRAKAWPLG